MTNETGLLRDMNLKPGDRVTNEHGDYTVSHTGGTIFNATSIYSIEMADRKYTVTYRAPRTIGTLKEIGAKVGDVVEFTRSAIGAEVHNDKYVGKTYTVSENGSAGGFIRSNENVFTIISRASDHRPFTDEEVESITNGIKGKMNGIIDGPVRTVTRKEIVPGVYGKVHVDMLGGLGVSVEELHDAEELTDAIATLTEIRDAL